MTMGILAGCGSNSNSGSANTGSNAGSNAADSSDASESTAAGTESTGNIDTADLAGTQITMLNSKGEIQTALEDMAEAFKEAVSYTHLKIRSGRPYSDWQLHQQRRTACLHDGRCC